MKNINIYLKILTALITASVLASPAYACELICVKTTAVYTGALGGYAGADAKCQSEFPGFKFPRSASLVKAFAGSHNTGSGAYYASPWGFFDGDAGSTYFAWSGARSGAGASQSSCNGWMSDSSSDKGGALYANTPYYFYAYPTGCNGSLPLVCCNM